MNLKRFAALVMAFAMMISICPVTHADNADEDSDTTVSIYERLPYFSEIYPSYPQVYPDKSVKLSIKGADSLKNEQKIVEGRNGEDALLWDAAQETVTWVADVPQAGQYVLEVGYKILGTSGQNAVRSLKINGETPFFEAEKIVFYRQWMDSGDTIVNSVGDEVRPNVVEKTGWQTVKVRDSSGFYGEPLVFYFDEGTNEITMQYLTQDMVIDSMVLRPYSPLVTYETYSKEYAKHENKKSGNVLKVFQAEDNVVAKNDATIRIESSSAPQSRPVSYGYRVYNSVGGYRWRKGSQSITFGFDVPEDGFYKIGFRFSQSWNDGLPSYRAIEIDDEIPFQELAAYRFNYKSGWQTEVLGGDGSPYLFYLEKGKHTLTMIVTFGELTPIIQSLYDDMVLISDFLQDITKLTGMDPDPNYDYEFFRFIPTLKGDMQSLVDSLKKKTELLSSITEKSTSMGSNFKSIINQIEKMIGNPFSIARKMNQINQAQASLGTCLYSRRSFSSGRQP